MSFHKSKIQKTSEQRNYVRGQQIEQIKQQKREITEAQQMESQNCTPQQLYQIVSTCDFRDDSHRNLKRLSCGSKTLDQIERLKLDTPQNLKFLGDLFNWLDQQRNLEDQNFKKKLKGFDQTLYQLGKIKFTNAIKYICQKFEAKNFCAVLHKQLISEIPEPDKFLLKDPFMMDKLLNQIYKGKQIKIKLKPHSIFAFIGLSRRQEAVQWSLIQNDKIILSDIEQRGVIAYFVLQYIAQFKPSEYLKKNESIRERLFKQVDLKKFILEKFNSDSQIQFHDVKDLGLKDINFVTVLSAFDLQRGFYYDSYVFNQERFRKSHPDADNCSLPIKWLIPEQPSNDSYIKNHQRKTVLNPIIFTGQIIRSLKEFENRLIYGDKGIGKSFTFLLYSYLSSYIIQARMQEQHQGLIKYKIYAKILRNGGFYKYPKLFYIPISDLASYEQFSMYIMEQINGEHQKKTINTETWKRPQTQRQFGSFHIQLRKLYNKKSIQPLIAVDQANSYYGLARRYFFNKIYVDDHEKLQQQSAILKFIKSKMSPYILNSSQNIEKLVLSSFLNQNSLYDYFAQNNSSETNIKLQYSPFLNEPEGCLQLYHIFTFEISKHLSTNIACRKFTVFNKIIQSILKNCKDYDLITPWKIYVRPFIISLAMKDNKAIRKNLDELKQCIQKIESSSQDFEEKQQISKKKIQYWFWKIKDQIQQIASLKIRALIVQFYKKFLSQSDKNYRSQLILQLRCAAFSMYNKPVQQFSINTSELINLCISDQESFLVIKSQQKMKDYFNELLSLLPIFRYQQNLEQLNIHCKPRQFIDKTNFIVSQIYKQQKIMNIYERIYSRKTSELTGFQFGFFLDYFAPRLFKKGYCRIQYKQHTSLFETNIMQFEIINGFQFESLTSTKDINKSFKHLLQHADKFPNQKFYCGAADKRNNQGFDFLLFRKKSNMADYEIYTFDFTTAKIQTKVNKRVSKTNQIATSQRKNMIEFFENANLSEDELSQLLQQIEKAFQQIDDHDKINFKSLFKLVISLTENNRKQNPLLDNILQLITPEGSSQNKTNNQQIGKRIQKFIARLKKYITNKIYINKMLAVFGVLTNTKQVDIPRKLQDSYNTNSRTFQYNIQLVEARAIFIKLILECSLSTKQNLIQFINQIHKESYQHHIDFPQQIKKKSFFKKYSQRHHFFTPLKHLNNYSSINGKNSLTWKHVIAVPSYRVQQYQQSLFKKKNKADYLFEKVTLPSNGTKTLQFAIGQFEFNQNSIRIIPQTKHLDNEDHILLQKQYKFIQSLMKIMKNKKKQL